MCRFVQQEGEGSAGQWAMRGGECDFDVIGCEALVGGGIMGLESQLTKATDRRKLGGCGLEAEGAVNAIKGGLELEGVPRSRHKGVMCP